MTSATHFDSEMDEFVTNPSPLSQKLVEVVARHNAYYQNKIRGNFWQKSFFYAQLVYYQRISHHKNLTFLKQSQKKIKKSKFKLEELLTLFSRIQQVIIFNNLALTHLYGLIGKSFDKDQHTPVLVFEQKKFRALKQLAQRKISKKKFDKEFGHYSLKDYELAEPRFSEYSPKEIQQLASFIKSYSVNDALKDVHSSYHQNPVTNQEIMTNLLFIRDYSRYVSVLIVAIMRKQILELSRKNSISNPFDLSWNKLTIVFS